MRTIIQAFRKAVFITVWLTLFCSASMAEIDQAIQAEMERFNDWYEKPQLDTSAKAVLDLFKLDYPGLEEVAKAYHGGDYEAAMAALLDYFRNRKVYMPLTEVTTQTPYDLKFAEQTLNHIIKGNKNYPPTFRGTKIDWVGKAVIDGEVIHDVEWLYHYHRLYWWTFLAKAFEETGRDDFFYEWRYELVTYTEDNLPITDETIWAIRRGMETYYRCEVAMRVLPTFIQSELFDTKLLCYYFAFYHHQAEHIRKVYADGGNHLLGEITRVFTNGLYFPELKKSDEWIEEGLERIPAMMKEMVYDEGMNKELVFSYHVMYCELFHEFYRQAAANGYDGYLPEGFSKTLKGLHDIMMIALLPDGSTPQFGDAWKYKRTLDGEFVPRYKDWIYRTWVERYPDEPHYRYLMTDGREGEAWEQTCFRFEQSGFHFFRNEWSPEAIYLALKYGEEARFHNQPDNGTFSLSAFGRDFMVDSGSYIYRSEDPEEKYWRNWFRRSSSHQTMTLGYADVTPDPSYLFWHDGPALTVAVVENQSYPGLSHRRSILFVNKRFFVIFDEAMGDATGDVRVHFQLNACEPVFEDEGMRVFTADPNMPNLLLKAFPQSEDVLMEKEEGWVSYLYGHKIERPAFAYKQVKDSPGPITFLTALLPVDDEISRDMADGLDVQVEKPSESNYIYQVTLGNRSWTITIDLEAGTISR